jgi:hypothetical protein
VREGETCMRGWKRYRLIDVGPGPLRKQFNFEVDFQSESNLFFFKCGLFKLQKIEIKYEIE